MIIYIIQNKLNGKLYVGQTVQKLSQRWREHKSRKEACKALSNAIHKYGQEAFHIEEIAWCDSIEELNHYEEFYIKKFNTIAPNGYNLTTGGKNYFRSKETKKRMSESGKIKKFSENHRLNLSIALKSRKLTKEHKLKIGVKRLNIKHSVDSKRKMFLTRTKSGFIGVGITKNNRWGSRLRYKNKTLHLGVFDTPIQAAKIYDFWARDLFGKFALTNF